MAKEEKFEKKEKVRERFNSFKMSLSKLKHKIKEEYMLFLFESKHGSLENMKKANNMFDKVFKTVIIDVIIWSFVVVFYFALMVIIFWKVANIPLLLTFPISFILIFVMKIYLKKLIFKIVGVKQ